MTRERRLVAIALLALAYYGLARFSLGIGALPGNVSPVWPPTGLSIAVLTLLGLDLAPGVFLGALIANLFTPIPPAAAVGMAIGNTLEAAIAAWAFRRASETRDTLSHADRVLGHASVNAGLATAVSATFGVGSLVLTGVVPVSAWWSVWRVWWVGDALGALVVGGAIFVWAIERRAPAGKRLEAVVLFATVVAVSIFVFSTHNPRAYLVFPLVIWATLRYNGRGATATTLVVATIAIARTAAGHGPFVHSSATNNLWTLDLYLAVVALTGLILAAIVAERDHASADASELRRSSELLRVAEERFRLSFEGAPIGMALLALDGSFSRVNQAMCDMLGYTRDELLAKRFHDITHPDDLVLDLEFVRQLLDGECTTYKTEKRYFDAKGQIVWAELNGTLVRDSEGNPSHFMGQLQDITQRRAANAQLRESEERALRASQMKSQFLANMSHEIRTPINGVVGMAELLADSPLSDAQREQVVAMRSAATSLLGLLNDILDLARVEAGKITLEATEFQVGSVVGETATLFAATAETKGIDLGFELLGDVDGWVRGDPTRLRQVLTNLVGNAVKFTDRGGVHVRVTRDDDWVRFEVIDTGIGIPSELQARLMTPFEQGDASTTRRYGGSGLGLAISQELIALMGGTITFASNVDAGTRVAVRVPLPSVAAPVAAPVEPVVERDPVPAAAVGRVLLAEDNAINQRVARAMLERLGWHVVVVDNGQAAVEQAAINEFEVIILDCQMPILDGYEAAKAIRRLPGRRGEVRIIALTASAYAEDRERCLDAGMNDYLSKPATREQLADALDRAVAVPS